MSKVAAERALIRAEAALGDVQHGDPEGVASAEAALQTVREYARAAYPAAWAREMLGGPVASMAAAIRRVKGKPMKNPRLVDRPATLRALYGDRQYRDYATPVLDVDFKPAVLKKLAAKGYVMQQGPYAIATWKGMTATEKGAGRFIPTAYGLEPTRGNGYALWDQQKGGWMSEAEFARRTGRANAAPYPVATKVFHSWQAAVDAAAGLNAPAPKKNPEGVNWNVRDFERDTRVRKRPYKPKLGTWVTIEIPRAEQPGANMELQYKGGKVLRYSGDNAVLLMAGEVRMPGEERGRSGREAWVSVRWLRPQGRKRRFNPAKAPKKNPWYYGQGTGTNRGELRVFKSEKAHSLGDNGVHHRVGPFASAAEAKRSASALAEEIMISPRVKVVKARIGKPKKNPTTRTLNEQVESLQQLYGRNVPLYVVTREFTGGTLKGLTYTEATTVPWEVGKVVKKPIGGSPYRIISSARLNPRRTAPRRSKNPAASSLFFKWSAPAPNWDGSIPKPWRVADLQALKTWMALGGYPDRVAYAEHDGDGMWVGVRDNRDSAKHAAELAVLLGKLKAAGANAVGVKRDGRIVGIRVLDRVKK